MTDDSTTTFTVKGLPIEAKELMAACAARKGMRLGPWLANAIQSQARIEQHDGVVFPDEAGLTAERPSLPADKHRLEAGKLMTLEELREISLIAAATAQASGQRQPRASARHVYALIGQRLKDAAGELPRPDQPRGVGGKFIQNIDWREA